MYVTGMSSLLQTVWLLVYLFKTQICGAFTVDYSWTQMRVIKTQALLHRELPKEL